MAPSIGDLTINVSPNNVTFSGTYIANSGIGNTTFDSSDFSVSGNYLVYVISDIDIIGQLTFVVNGNTYHINTYDGMSAANVHLGNWYAWTGYVDTQGGTTVTWYTLSATPSIGDAVYQTPPNLASVVTTNTTIVGDIDTYKLKFGADISVASASSITVGNNNPK